METSQQFLITLANQECLTGSLNSLSLLETLRSLSPEEASSKDTYEGYTAWGMALHVLYYKHLVAVELGAKVPSYTYEKKDYPELPSIPSREAWDKLVGEIEQTHRSFIAALEKAEPELLAAPYESWEMPLGEAIGWIISHDTYHNAQIRNMGLASLREPIE